MPIELPDDEPGSIWRAQPSEGSAITMETMQRKARELQTRMRRSLLANVALTAIAAGCYAFGAIQVPKTRLLFLLSIAWSAAGIYFLNRGIPPSTTPSEAGWRTGIESYRRQVARRRIQINSGLLWSFAPALLAIGAFVFGLSRAGNIFRQAMPFIMLVLVWVMG